jgi:hypothetical protein
LNGCALHLIDLFVFLCFSLLLYHFVSYDDPVVPSPTEERPYESAAHNGALVPANNASGKLRFVQLYTSKSFSNRRSMLVTPPEDEIEDDYNHDHDHECTAADLEKHKLSPRLVNAISKTAQVVWANTLKHEGLTGRSDIPLHTAVGMPVAMDAEGNMCVVVMFSQNNIQGTDEAMEYLQLISRSATSSSIPCLMPAFESTDDIRHVQTSGASISSYQKQIMPEVASSFGEGVTTRFVSIDDERGDVVHGHNLATAPKDCFGIPMLPTNAELDSNNPMSGTYPPGSYIENGRDSPPIEDVFDEASYGVWSTIMQERPPVVASPSPSTYDEELIDIAVEDGLPVGHNEGFPNPALDNGYFDPNSLIITSKRSMDRKRKERLEEFCSAFLGMSVFDVADVWIPAGPSHPDCLSNVTSITANIQSNVLTEFKRVSGYTLVEFWSGAVGRAYSSGNPVWSCNPVSEILARVCFRLVSEIVLTLSFHSAQKDVYIDKGRAKAFERANIMTAFAVPIQSGSRATPVGVVCCYSMIQAGSVPFVLRFVQQALHLLWSGLDKVQPHESVGRAMWQDVGPADLGEMAADVEMQHHFLSKKRPRDSGHSQPEQFYDVDDLATVPLASQFKGINFQIDDQEPPEQASHEFSTANPTTQRNVPRYEYEEKVEEFGGFYNLQQLHLHHEQPPERRVSVQAMQAFQNHIKDAVRQAATVVPFAQSHMATTSDGSKRAHISHSETSSHESQRIARRSSQPAPLAMPLALPTRLVKAGENSHHSSRRAGEHGPVVAIAPRGPVVDIAPRSPVSTAPVPPPQVYVLPPSAVPAPQFTQHTMPQPLLVQSPAPTRLSQNVLSQGMLHSIANQQYQFSYDAASPTEAVLCETGASQYATPMEPIIATTPEALQQTTHFCMPTSSGMYPVPDVVESEPFGTISEGGAKVKVCRIEGCDDVAAIRRPYCARHSGNRLCEQEGCNKCAQGSTRFCIAHGGGRRCTHPGCDKGARDKFFCAAHGGGKRCKAVDCNKSAVGGSSLCTAHGGGRRCCIDGCDKSAQSSTKFCVKHGGGKKCCFDDCEKVARGRTQYCAAVSV